MRKVRGGASYAYEVLVVLHLQLSSILCPVLLRHHLQHDIVSLLLLLLEKCKELVDDLLLVGRLGGCSLRLTCCDARGLLLHLSLGLFPLNILAIPVCLIMRLRVTRLTI